MTETFKAWVVREDDAGGFGADLETCALQDLPDGDVLIRVSYSSLNYKDVLSFGGNKGVTRQYPHTPGVDASGTVVASTAPGIAEGSEVLVTGYDLGMNTHGGLGEYIRVPAEWVVPLPGGLSGMQAMAFGTAGFTAAQSVLALRYGGAAPEQGDVLVTGATGGVGSLAVLFLARAGFRVFACTGKPDAAPMLSALGASTLVSREDVLSARARPLAKARWAHVVDTVGGDFLDAGLRATQPKGVVTTCGMVASAELSTNVFPFILRGIRLQGIDSAAADMVRRLEVWQFLSDIWTDAAWDQLVRVVALDDVLPEIEAMSAGQSRGRVVVRVGHTDD